jgi:hypothetical protein
LHGKNILPREALGGQDACGIAWNRQRPSAVPGLHPAVMVAVARSTRG